MTVCVFSGNFFLRKKMSRHEHEIMLGCFFLRFFFLVIFSGVGTVFGRLRPSSSQHTIKAVNRKMYDIFCLFNKKFLKS